MKGAGPVGTWRKTDVAEGGLRTTWVERGVCGER